MYRIMRKVARVVKSVKDHAFGSSIRCVLVFGFEIGKGEQTYSECDPVDTIC